ncbi:MULTISPECIES: energy-coupling factor transporter transmembrane protein EcfT [unclassified Paenibacillus]|uniref:energy-coupling factor transporter transmembrane component T family protein n=1 Tax=Paenibacillus TaxID=44249 RepID=UPI000BA51491|nr:energy-coupling factor transporter transmembrane component T [Paenibacillus sp. 7541]PAK51485.1 cobalt transporter [Paenibacillus sp. 7541]
MLIQFETGNTLLHRMDPLSKMTVLFCVAVMAMVLDHFSHQAGLLLLCIAAARGLAGLSWMRIARGIRLIAIVAVPYFVLTSLTASGETVVLAWGPLAFTAEALNAAAAMSLRMIVLFLSSLVYIVTTDPRALVTEMVVRLRLPYRFAFGISAALTFIPLLEAEGTQILAAHQVRGHRPPKGITGRIRWWGRFVTAVLLNALRRVQQTAGAMESKGFGAFPDRTFRKAVTIPWWSPWSAAAGVLLTLLVCWIV